MTENKMRTPIREQCDSICRNARLGLADANDALSLEKIITSLLFIIDEETSDGFDSMEAHVTWKNLNRKQ